jgi:hypothetical protein
MFTKIVQAILEGYGVVPMDRIPLTRGPDTNFHGPVATGFLGDSLGGSNIPILVKKKKKRKKIKKKKA